MQPDSFIHEARDASAAAMTCMHTTYHVNASPSCTYHRRRMCTRQFYSWARSSSALAPACSCFHLRSIGATVHLQPAAHALFCLGVDTLMNCSCSSNALLAVTPTLVGPAGAQSQDSRTRVKARCVMLDNSSPEAGAEVGRQGGWSLRAADANFKLETSLSQAGLHSP